MATHFFTSLQDQVFMGKTKKIFFIGALLLAICPVVYCEDFKLNKERITQYKKDMVVQFKRRNMSRKVIKCATAGLVAYTAYTVYNHFFGESGDESILSLNKNKSADGYGAQFKKWVTSGDTWFNIGKYATTSLVVNTVTSRMQELLQPETILWFVVTNASYVHTLKVINWYGQKSVESKIELDEKHKQLLLVQCARLADQCEQMVAFMLWKANHLSTSDATENARLVARELYKESNEKIALLRSAIVDNQALISYYADSMFLMLQHECVQFAQVEKSHWIDPNMLMSFVNQLA